MKKAILILICTVLFAGLASAQTSLRVGIKGGLNFANLDSEADLDSRTGFHAGAFATIKISKIAIQPELIFSQQGAQFSVNSIDLESNFTYLNVPVMAKLYLIGGLNIQVGPQFGFLLSADQESVDIFSGEVTEEDVKDALKGSDVSVGLGAGLDLPFGLTFDARYNLGITDVNDTDFDNETKNQVFQISVGYRFIDLGN